jgi:hypothetical protein
MNSETVLEIDEFELDDETSDSDSGADHGDEILGMLKTRPLVLADSSKNLTELIVSEVCKVLRLGPIDGAYTTATSHGTNGNVSTYGASTSSSSTSTPTNASNLSSSKLRKRGLGGDESDEADEANGHGGNKRHRSKGNDIKRTFACHFHKKHPYKYDPRNDRKYYMCPAPLKEDSEFRHIK